ncbi:ribonuclease H-like domain-containing protein [Tanacetum coccineum]
MRVNLQNFSKRDFAPIAVLTKSGIVPVSAARPINTATPNPFMNVARTRPNSFHKSHSTSRTPFNQLTALKNRNLNDRVNTAKVNSVNTAKHAGFGDQNKMLLTISLKTMDHTCLKDLIMLIHKADSRIFDSGCSRHMTGNKFYLSNYQDIDGGSVAFRGSSKGGDLTCLFAKATIDESNLWHRRLGHINFKTMNKLVRGNLVRGLPSKLFENDHTCVACQIGKQHKASCRKPALSFMRPFGCPVTILNTLDHLGTGPNWMFDIDGLTMSMNYQPVFTGNQTNGNAGTKENIDARQAEMNTVPDPQYVLLPFLTSDSQSPKNSEDEVVDDAGKKNGVEDPAKQDDINDPGRASDQKNEFESMFGHDKDANSTYRMLTSISAAESSYENLGGSTPVNVVTPSNADYPTNPLMSDLEDTANLHDTGIFGNAYDDEDVGAEAGLNNLETTMNVSPIPTTRIHKDYPKEQIIRDINSATQTRRMIKMSKEHAMISYINKQRRTNYKDYQNCLFAYFLSQMEPKKVIQALAYSSWVESTQEELLTFRLQKVWR